MSVAKMKMMMGY